MATGIFPETEAGGVPIRNPDGTPTNPSNVQNVYVPAPAYVSTCELTALPSDCEARIQPKQINAIVSELLAFAECLDPDGPWECDKPNNLCTAFNNWIEAYEGLNTDLFVNVNGDTMTGPLQLPPGAPTDPTEATNKQYVDDTIGAAIAAAEGLDETKFVNVAGDTMSGDLSISKTAPWLHLSAQGVTAQGGVELTRDNLGRWFLAMQGGGEPGANQGSDLLIGRCSDAGAFIDVPFIINRATGRMSANGNPTDPLGLATKQYVDAAVAGAVAPAFAAGTRMLFLQTAAPVGWTKDATAALNDSILRVVTGAAGAGGANAFSTVNAQSATGNHSLALAALPSGITSSWSGQITVYPNGQATNHYLADAHYNNAHVYTVGLINTSSTTVPPGYPIPYSVGTAADTFSYVSADWGTNTVASTSNNTGAGAHNHPITMNIKYVDSIVAIKD